MNIKEKKRIETKSIAEVDEKTAENSLLKEEQEEELPKKENLLPQKEKEEELPKKENLLPQKEKEEEKEEEEKEEEEKEEEEKEEHEKEEEEKEEKSPKEENPENPPKVGMKETPKEELIPESYILENEEEENKIKYSYLEDNPLNRMDPTIDTSRKYVKGMCFYKINENLEEPFLEFFFVKKNGVFAFPMEYYEPGLEGIGKQIFVEIEKEKPFLKKLEETIEKSIQGELTDNTPINLLNYSNLQEDEDVKSILESTLEDYFKEKSSDWFSFPKDEDFWERHYQGFIHFSFQEMIYYIGFIDSTYLEVSPRFLAFTEFQDPEVKIEKDQIEEIRWGIVDEIIEKKNILNVPIHPFVYQLFIQRPFLGYVKTNSHSGNKIAALPHCLYLCQEDGKGNFDNIYYNEQEPLLKQKQTVTLFKPYLFTPHFGKTHFFTTEPLDNNEKVSHIKRYAVLIQNPVHVFNQDSEISEFPDLFDNDNIEENIFFYINQYAFWSIRNADSFVEIL
jgi:hypothetical protein